MVLIVSIILVPLLTVAIAALFMRKHVAPARLETAKVGRVTEEYEGRCGSCGAFTRARTYLDDLGA